MDIDIFPRAIRKRAIGTGLIIAGVLLIGMATNWTAAIGVFTLVTGNNIERRFRQ